MKVGLKINIAEYEILDLYSSEHETLKECHEEIKELINFYAFFLPKVSTYKKIFDKKNTL